MKKLRKILNETILKINKVYPTEINESSLDFLSDMGLSQTEIDDFTKNYECVLKEIKIPLIDDDVSPSELLEIFDGIMAYDVSPNAMPSSVEAMATQIPQGTMMDVLMFLGNAKEEDEEDVFICKLLNGCGALYDMFEIVGMTPSCVRLRTELEKIMRPLGLRYAE